MRFVYHVDDETAHITVDGRMISIPPNEIFEVPELRGNHFNNNGPCEYIITEAKVAEELIRQGWYHGIVDVPIRRSKNGMEADVEAARKLATALLIDSEDKILGQYISDQQERTTVHGKAAIAPIGRVLKIIEARGIDLEKDYNISPPGYGMAKARNRDAEVEELKHQMAELQKALMVTAKEKRPA
jgi:hypothetical protein